MRRVGGVSILLLGVLAVSLGVFERDPSANQVSSKPLTSVTVPVPEERVAGEEKKMRLPGRTQPSEPTSEQVFDQATGLDIIGAFIDPDRGPSLSSDLAAVAVGEYIDPDRGPDFSEPENPIIVGEYIDPEQGAIYEVDPREVISIGAFIDPDALSDERSRDEIIVGEYTDPNRP